MGALRGWGQGFPRSLTRLHGILPTPLVLCGAAALAPGQAAGRYRARGAECPRPFSSTALLSRRRALGILQQKLKANKHNKTHGKKGRDREEKMPRWASGTLRHWPGAGLSLVSKWLGHWGSGAPPPESPSPTGLLRPAPGRPAPHPEVLQAVAENISKPRFCFNDHLHGFPS